MMTTRRATRGPLRTAVLMGVVVAVVLWGLAYLARHVYPPASTPRGETVTAITELETAFDPTHAQQCAARGRVVVVPVLKEALANDRPARLACVRWEDLEWIDVPRAGESTP